MLRPYHFDLNISQQSDDESHDAKSVGVRRSSPTNSSAEMDFFIWDHPKMLKRVIRY